MPLHNRHSKSFEPPVDVLLRLGLALRALEFYLSEQLGSGMELSLGQVLIVARMGDTPIRVRALHKLHMGTNISYNLKVLVDRGYLEIASHGGDRRARMVSLTGKGKELRGKVRPILSYMDEGVGQILPLKTISEIVAWANLFGNSPRPAPEASSRQSIAAATT